MTNIKIYIILLILLSACAIQKPPSGGPPDTTPPVILSTFPDNFSTHFKEDYVRFEFSKYMNKTQVIENVFISPDIDVNYDWSGKKLDIEFEEELKPNTTYSISLGTDYTDLKGNKPEMAYSIVFSTGDKIDTCKISGKLFDNKPDGAFIFAYLLDGINPDTLNPKNTKPTYRTQIGSNGLFQFSALKPGKYRIFAVRDIMKDGLYDHGTDGFSSSMLDFTTSQSRTPWVDIKLGAPIDDVGPMLYSVEPLTQSIILAEFSESLDSSTVNRKTFIITDSSKSKKVAISSAFLKMNSPNIVKIFAKTPLDTNTKWLLQVRTDSLYALRDSLHNIIQDTVSSAYFYAVADGDTNDLKLMATMPKDSTENVPTNSVFDFIFNNSIIEQTDNIIIDFLKTSDGSNVEMATSYPQENIIRLRTLNRLESVKKYQIKIQNALKDSIIYLTFQTADERNYGGLAGIIIYSSSYNGNYLITLFAKDDDKSYSLETREKKWKFPNLPPGDYQLEIVSDINDNSKYDFGNPYPWEPAEKFLQLPGTIQVKPRWTVEDFKIIYFGQKSEEQSK